MSNAVQRNIDRFWQLALFGFLPRSLTPDFFTVTRFVFIPFIVLALALGNYRLALALFVLAALSDSLDGALARYRRLVSVRGAFLDIVADKLLNILALTFLALSYPEPWLLFLVVMFDLLTLGGGLALQLVLKLKDFKSDFFGKTKVALEMVGMIAALAGLGFGLTRLVSFSIWIFVALLFFEIISIVVYWLKSAR